MSTEKIKFMLLAQDMDRALAFYRQVFGLSEGFRSDHWSELHHGDVIVAFHGGHDGSRNRVPLSIQVSDAKQTCREVVEHGGRLTAEPVARSGEPIMLGEIADPEGNEIMLTQWIA